MIRKSADYRRAELAFLFDQFSRGTFPANKLQIGREAIEKNVVFLDNWSGGEIGQAAPPRDSLTEPIASPLDFRHPRNLH